MKIVGVILVVLFYSCSSLSAQRTVTGTITNFRGESLEGVLVKAKSTKVSVFSDKNGRYRITLPRRKKKLVFDFEHYLTIELDVSKDVIDVQMEDAMAYLFEMSIEELLEMKIGTAGKTKQKIADIPASVVIIDREEIEQYGYQSLFEILNNIPGFYKSDDYEGISFGVRGFFSNARNRSFVLLVNGVPQAHPRTAWNTEMLTNIHIETIDRIEVVRGPMAVMYGVNAFFGVINVITNERKDSLSSSRVSTGYGTDNTYRFNVQTKIAKEKMKASISAGYYRTDGRDIPFDPILDSISDYAGKYYYSDQTTKGFFKRRSYYFNISSMFNDFYLNLSLDETDKNQITNFPPILDTLKINYQYRIVRGNLCYRKDIGEKITVDASVGLAASSTLGNARMAFVEPVKLEHGQFWAKSTKWLGELALLYRPIDGMLLTLGGKSVSTEFDYTIDADKFMPNHVYKADRPIIENSVYAQIDYKLNEQFSFVAGARLTKQERYEMTNTYFLQTGELAEIHYSYDIDDAEVVPRFAVVYKPTEKSSLKLMYGEALSRPSIIENMFINNLRHANLKPQFISTIELNYMAVLTDQLTLSTSVFYNQLDQLIVRSAYFNPEAKTVSFIPDNSGEMETIGGELQVQYSPSDALSLDFALSYHQTQNKKFDVEASYSPDLLAYVKAWYKITEDISVAITSNYVGKMETYWDDSPVAPANPNSPHKGRFYDTTPSYWTLNANFRYNDVMGTGLYFNVQGTNLLNKDIFYGPTLHNYSYFPKGTYDTGIGVFANVGLKF